MRLFESRALLETFLVRRSLVSTTDLGTGLFRYQPVTSTGDPKVLHKAT